MLSKPKLIAAAAIASGLWASLLAAPLVTEAQAAIVDIRQPGPNYSEFGHVVGIETGWLDDTMGVKLDVPFVNSSRPCKITTAGYALDPADRGVKLHQSMLLSAFLAGRKVRVLVQGCVYDKPRIIGVGIGEPIY